jgi:signal transduction histidine kinase
VRISVADEGPGVSPAHAERVFEAFFTTKPGGDGTGLGLSITRDSLREHGGWIELASIAGSGTRFDVWWPVATPARSGERSGPI